MLAEITDHTSTILLSQLLTQNKEEIPTGLHEISQSLLDWPVIHLPPDNAGCFGCTQYRHSSLAWLMAHTYITHWACGRQTTSSTGSGNYKFHCWKPIESTDKGFSHMGCTPDPLYSTQCLLHSCPQSPQTNHFLDVQSCHLISTTGTLISQS